MTTKEVMDVNNNTYNNMKGALTILDGQIQRVDRIKGKTADVEVELSLHDQIFEVLNDREAFNKLKLVIIIALLSLAILIVLYMKF